MALRDEAVKKKAVEKTRRVKHCQGLQNQPFLSNPLSPPS
jgi:hypothetical protein